MSRLPTKPSELIRVAIADLEKVEADPRYRVSMVSWHAAVPSEPCAVCLAGAVMARSLGADPSEFICPTDMPQETGALLALDAFRLGDIGYAFEQLDIELPAALPSLIEVASYHKRPSVFKADMLEMADMLEGAGF